MKEKANERQRERKRVSEKLQPTHNSHFVMER